MNQIKYILFTLLLIPLTIYAEDSYEATIIGNNVHCYKEAIDYSGDRNYHMGNGMLQYNDKIRIMKTEELKDTRLVMNHNGCYIKYNQFIGGHFNPKTFKITKYDTPRNLVVLNNNVKMYGGPNQDYLDFDNTYNSNIIFQYQYSIENRWFFIYYKPEMICNKGDNYISCSSKEKNAMGWGYINNKNFGIDGSEILYFPKDVDVLDSNGNTIGKIPAKQEITKYYYTYENNKKIIYTYYNNIEGYIYDIPLFKGNAKINLNNKEIFINYFNFQYRDKAFIYYENQLLTLDYNNINIINENTDIKSNSYISDLFNDYKIMNAPILNYELQESNKEDKEILPENYIIHEISEIKDNLPTPSPIENNSQNHKTTYKFILYVLALIIVIIMIIILRSYRKQPTKAKV